MKTAGDVSNEATALNSESLSDNEDIDPLRCWDCNVNFTSKHYLYDHLFHHIKQPQVSLTRVQLPPLKLTLKNKTGNSFEIVSSPTSSGQCSPSDQHLDAASNLAEIEEDKGESQEDESREDKTEDELDDDANVSFSPNFAEVNVAATSPANSDSSIHSGAKIEELGDGSECGSIPGAEPTPPPEPSPDYPKIRIKTTGLLKEPLTITEITDDNPEGDVEMGGDEKKDSWSSSMEDPLKLPGNDDILSIFNNNERAKDFGFTTSDSEFIPLDRLGDRNSNALQLYNQNQMNQNALSSLTGLPMEALAQQVSRLQPSGNGMHQQNVLINIQQFPQAPPPPPPYHPPNLYHHPPQPMYHPPYPSYQPPNPMYYPPGGGYPQHMPPPPPQSQMPQLGQPPMGQPPMGQPQMGQPPTSQAQNMQNQGYRPMGPRQPPPRQMQQPQRMPLGPRQPMNNQRQPMPRQRAPMVRPRGGGGMTAVRSIRPRMPLQNGMRQQVVKRTPEQLQALQAKKKRLDVLTPDKDDEDCQVICMQPKNMDGGLPQISSVQGGTTEPSESSVMHLSDSITLSVRNPQPRPQSPKKSDAKAVANILATRGITVTATPKPKDKADAQKNSSAIPPQLNLNAAVSIIPSAKNNNKSPNSSGQESHLPTVDLTDDTSPVSQPMKTSNSPQKGNPRQGLPFKCDLCPAQYPNAMGLSKHRQNYHKTNSGMCEIGVPLINLKQPGIFQKLSSMGIFNYIPLPSSGPDGMFALPIINGRNPGNVAALGATTMLTLGPVRNIPRPQSTVNGTQGPNKPMNQK